MRISDWSSDVCSSDLVGDLLRHHRLQPALALEILEMDGIGGFDDVGIVDAGRDLLPDALEDALRARALDLDVDVRILELEQPGELLGDRDVGRRVEDDLALALPRGLALGRPVIGRGRLRQIGSANVRTPVPNAQPSSRLSLK